LLLAKAPSIFAEELLDVAYLAGEVLDPGEDLLVVDRGLAGLLAFDGERAARLQDAVLDIVE
jgi:hypothetical protein